jgi:hypothetical protein
MDELRGEWPALVERTLQTSPLVAELVALPRDRASSSALFRDVTRLAEELEGGLLTLLFDTDLAHQVRDFGIF